MILHGRIKINTLLFVRNKNQFMKAIVLFAIIAMILAGCSEKTTPEDKVKLIDHNGSIETEVSVAHLDSISDILTTTHKIWAHDSLVKTYITNDTLPALGKAYNMAEDGQGQTEMVQTPHDYEIYITVK
jgi:hypothetical protein